MNAFWFLVEPFVFTAACATVTVAFGGGLLYALGYAAVRSARRRRDAHIEHLMSETGRLFGEDQTRWS